jgi:L-serine deaminase
MIAVMLQTGKDLKRNYRETSIGGLAKAYLKKNK